MKEMIFTLLFALLGFSANARAQAQDTQIRCQYEPNADEVVYLTISNGIFEIISSASAAASAGTAYSCYP